MCVQCAFHSHLREWTFSLDFTARQTRTEGPSKQCQTQVELDHKLGLLLCEIKTFAD